MKERLIEFLRSENKSSAQLAEEIGVQPSGISHILSGRNNPSLDFVLKMLEKYQFLSTDWLLFGKGTMYKDFHMQTLFDERIGSGQETDALYSENITDRSPDLSGDPGKAEKNYVNEEHERKRSPSLKRIVWFFSDNSFEEYFPGKV